MRERLLVRHFLWRFMENDLVSPDANRREVLSAAGGTLVTVSLVRWIRPALLSDPDPSWAIPRYLLWLLLASAAAFAGGLAAGAFFLWIRSWLGRVAPGPLPLSRSSIAALAAAALAVGVFLRAVWLSKLPFPFLSTRYASCMARGPSTLSLRSGVRAELPAAVTDLVHHVPATA